MLVLMVLLLSSPLLADLDGDDTLESTYIVIRYNGSDYGLLPIDSYVVCSGIDYPENLLPLPQYPLLPMIMFVLLIIHLFMRRPR